MLYEYYGKECPHCLKMMELTDKLMQEFPDVKVQRKEVWHNKTNMAEVESLDNGECGGIPFFYNSENKKWLCGEVSYDEIKKWAGVQ